jgi:hypothetical protein
MRRIISFSRVGLVVWSTALAILIVSSGRSPSAQTPAAPSKKYALLIGVTRYPHLAQKYQLQGPLNDVALLRTTLEGKLGFDDEFITELTESPSAVARPTRATSRRNSNASWALSPLEIRCSFSLRDTAASNPMPIGPKATSSMVLDEVFLPADAAGWDGRAGRNHQRDRRR